MPAQRGLVIGINQYPLLPPERQLTGCVNDAHLMHSLLQQPFGFAAEHLSLLTDAEATRDNILGALKTLVESTAKDDIVVVYFAGHGSQMTDLEYDEPSGYDSTIMPHDSGGWRGNNRDITDDEIALQLEALAARTRFITLIFDCCHSGTITRDSGSDVPVRSVPPDTRTREELLKERTPLAPREQQASGPSGWFAVSESHVLIAGCRDTEESAEYRATIDGKIVPHGALTWHLTREMLKAGPTTTYRDVFETAAAQVTAYSSSQHPQMEGKGDRVLFGTSEFEPMRYLPVTTRNGERVTFSAGAAHGVTTGSRYSIQPIGAKRAEPGTTLGEIEITAVSALNAEGRITSEGTPGAIVANARAFEVSHAFGDFRLRVALPDSGEAAVQALRAQLLDSTLVELVTEAGDGVRLTLLPARNEVRDGDPVPGAGALRSPTWAVTSSLGNLVAPLKRVGEETAIRSNLEKIARYRQGLAINNPDPNSLLQGKFTLELLRVPASGVPEVAVPAEAGGQVVYEEGDKIAFRVTSTHNAPVFVTLIDFGISGAVTSIHPYKEARAQVPLRAEGTFDYDVRPGMVFDVRWPENFPYAESVENARETVGVETIRLFVTEKPTDFSVLQQVALRTGGTRLGDLLTSVFNGNPTRDLGRNEPVDCDWTVVTRSFVVRRKPRP